jgi:hypothetical protein
MRAQGIDAKRALEILRPQINVLPADEQVDLVKQIRQLEAQDAEERRGDSRPSKPTIKPISKPLPRVDPNTLNTNARTLPIPSDLKQPVPAMVNCPHCGRPNGATEKICFSCGKFLDAPESSTRQLGENSNSRDSFFGSESVLVLMVRGSNVSFKIRPQRKQHPVVLGRADASVRVDVDLTEFGAATMGVSRNHASIHYDQEHATLNVMDQNTVNGTYINGVKLLPSEVRVLRHGDELRLGQLVLTLHFYFASD